MAVQINNYTGLKAGVLAWMARETDQRIDARFDDFLTNMERRMYYGFATEQPDNPLHSEPLRIPEMETVDPAFVLYDVVPQPDSFLELISVQLNSPNAPLQIVAQRIIDGYVSSSPAQARMIAVSGTNFRVFPASPQPDNPEEENPFLIWYLNHWQLFDPDTGKILTFVQTVPAEAGPNENPPTAATSTATLRYYQKLTTPSPAASNAILSAYPDVYLNGVLVEASIFAQDRDAALYYLSLYNASVSGLNSRTQRITASAVPVMRLRAGMVV